MGKQLWLRGRDLNMKYFCNVVKKKRWRNAIAKIRDMHGSWVDEERDGVSDIMMAYFITLFSSQQGYMHDVLQCVRRQVTSE